MTKLIIISFLIFKYNITFCQTQITVKFPFEQNLINCFVYTSLSQKIYVNIENQIRIEVPNIKTRNLELWADTSELSFKTVWRPIIKNKIWSDLFAEYTLATAEKLGAYYPSKKLNNEKYIDTNGIYWEKEYIINPRTAKEIHFNLHINEGRKDSLLFYNNFHLFSNYVPIPTITILELSYFETNNVIEQNIDLDFINAEDWFKITSYTFITYDKKGRELFKQICFGNIITTEMKTSLKNRKMKTLKIKNIKSQKYEYQDFEIKK